MITTQLINRVMVHEGLAFIPYKDTEGHLTIGHGHKLSRPITNWAAEIILRDDLTQTERDLKYSTEMNLNYSIEEKLDNLRYECLIEMAFQLGVTGCLNFKKMWQAILAEDFDQAAYEMLDSKWAKQCKARVQKMAEIMRKGED